MLNLKNFSILDSDYLQVRYGVANSYILFIGRLSDVKDIEFLIELWSEKFEFDSKVKLIIAGDGEQKSKLIDLSNELLHNKPIFLGEVNPENIPTLISSSNMVVLASKHEASPTVVKESISLGIPIISNKVGDVEDYVLNGKNGYIVNKDYDAYFNAIKNLLDNPLSKEEVLKNSREQLEQCSVEHVSNQYMNIYRRLEV